MTKNSETPFHMREVDHPVLPDDPDVPPDYTEEPPSGSDLVDIGTIDTFPKVDFAQYTASGEGLASFARVGDDGRITISLDLKKHLPELPKEHAPDVEEFGIDKAAWKDCPPLSIVIMIVGSRGDVQPYVALGKRLLQHGHRIRIATHEIFQDFVTGHGLEFFAIGGNPQDLMSYMVKNPGLMPGMDSLMNGDISRKRKMLTEMMDGCWLACHSRCPLTGKTFAADAMISNPPAFAHIHCAEALGIPLLLSFTMPWQVYRSPTTAFPHPLVNISASNAEGGLTNYLSYALADILTWQGIGDIVNKFRAKTLGLEPLSVRSGPGLVDTLKVPWTYCMSPALVPKPNDWKNHIDVVGFYFLDLATNYTPADDLVAFLAKGEPPVYVGFGSVVVDDPAKMSKIIFEATRCAGVRALVSAGWGGLGGVSVPPHIFMIGNIPHDWLFDQGRISAVVHHGGAGTTSAGLSKGLPTVVVPFFGDQEFWGNMIHKAGAGPAPIRHKKLDIDGLCNAIKFAISPSAKTAAQQMARQIQSEDGISQGIESLYRHLPLKNMRCDLVPTRAAVWWSTEHCLRLSAFAAQTLVDARKIKLDSLDLHRSKEYDSRKTHTDPFTGTASGIFWTITHHYAGIAQIFYSPMQGIVNTTTAIPQGIAQIVAGMHEGFENIPRLYGSDVRQHGEVTNFSSGLKEGGKALFYGYYDGITGLVREPIQGAREEGFKGAIKGSARSFINATMRPAAGIVGIVAHPLNGIWKSAQSMVAKKQEHHQLSTRISDGQISVKESTYKERADVLRAFKDSRATLIERRNYYRKAAEKELFGFEKGKKSSADSSSTSPTTSTTGGSALESTPTPFQQCTDEEYERAFEKELEMVKQLSFAEQQGYERGLSAQLER